MARILVIDDDPQVLRMFEEFIRRLGHEVTTAEEGDEGLEEMRRHPADIVITDIFMPGKEGLTTIREMRTEFPQVPIVALSGGERQVASDNLTGRIDFLEAAERFGATRTLTKPVDMEELTETIFELLQPRT